MGFMVILLPVDFSMFRLLFPFLGIHVRFHVSGHVVSQSECPLANRADLVLDFVMDRLNVMSHEFRFRRSISTLVAQVLLHL